MESVQDNPPTGGYPKVSRIAHLFVNITNINISLKSKNSLQFNISRGIKPRGPSGAIIWGVVLSLSFLGFTQVKTQPQKRIKNI